MTINELPEVIKHIWINRIKEDFDEKMILNEDTLKSLFYYHLRLNLSELILEDNIRIFTEFTVQNKKIADLAIVNITVTHDIIDIVEVLALLEFKYKKTKNPLKYIDGFSNSSIKPFHSDLLKLKGYGDFDNRTLLFGAFISEFNYPEKFNTWMEDIEHFFDENVLLRMNELVGIIDDKTGEFKTFIEPSENIITKKRGNIKNI